MKKLMTFAVALCAAVVTNAASVVWQVSGSTATENYQVFLVGAVSDSWKSVADLASDAAAYGTAGTSGTIAKSGRVFAAGPYSASIDSISKTSADVYFVIVSGADATGYNYVKVDLSGYAYEGAESASGTYLTTADTLLAGTSGTFGAVPEPTSGLLLLLGGAGLALRRKRK